MYVCTTVTLALDFHVKNATFATGICLSKLHFHLDCYWNSYFFFDQPPCFG